MAWPAGAMGFARVGAPPRNSAWFEGSINGLSCTREDLRKNWDEGWWVGLGLESMGGRWNAGAGGAAAASCESCNWEAQGREYCSSRTNNLRKSHPKGENSGPKSVPVDSIDVP